MAEKLIADNRRARFDYQLLDRFEAGIVLQGTEVKALRDGRASLAQAYAEVREGEAWLVGAEIQPYGHGNVANHEPLRDRRLAGRDKVALAMGARSEVLSPIYYSAAMPGPFLGIPDEPPSADAARRQELEAQMGEPLIDRSGGRERIGQPIGQEPRAHRRDRAIEHV